MARSRLLGVAAVALVLGILAPSASGAQPGGFYFAGYNYYAEGGTGTYSEFVTKPILNPYLSPTVTALAGSDYSTYAVLAGGVVEDFGWAGGGALGNGGEEISPTFPEVLALPAPATDIAGGYNGFALAALANGTVAAWGDNTYGEVGIGTSGASKEQFTPALVPGLEGVLAVAAGCYTSYALRADGKVEAWGYGGGGNLGNGTETSAQTTPVEVAGLEEVVAIAANCETAYALLADGKVKSWGLGSHGELGNGTIAPKQTTPVEVSGLEGVTAIAAGYYAGYALLGDGTVASWGYNTTGELGDGTSTERDAPVAVSGLTGVRSIGASAQTGYAVLASGAAYGWGYGFYGELGERQARGGSRSEIAAADPRALRRARDRQGQPRRRAARDPRGARVALRLERRIRQRRRRLHEHRAYRHAQERRPRATRGLRGCPRRRRRRVVHGKRVTPARARRSARVPPAPSRSRSARPRPAPPPPRSASLPRPRTRCRRSR